MTRHNDRVRLKHMLNHSIEAIELVKDKKRKDLDKDRTLELALTRLVEIVGEAATKVSQGTREKHPHIPWPEIIGLRNRLIHGYDAVDLDILWEIVKSDLPSLVEDLREI